MGVAPGVVRFTARGLPVTHGSRISMAPGQNVTNQPPS